MIAMPAMVKGMVNFGFNWYSAPESKSMDMSGR